jgi:hypothetical protein
MQVYDRVVPTGASQTLWVLTSGVLLAVLFETLAKLARSRLFEQLVDQVDQKLAREVYSRFLAIRLDQLPRSVGTLASQLRGYESVRGFLTAMTSHLMFDLPGTELGPGFAQPCRWPEQEGPGGQQFQDRLAGRNDRGRRDHQIGPKRLAHALALDRHHRRGP